MPEIQPCQLLLEHLGLLLAVSKRNQMSRLESLMVCLAG